MLILVNTVQNRVYSPFLVCFAIFELNFFMLKAMAKKAQSIETLSFPKWRNLYFSFAIIIRWNCNGLCIRFVTAREGEFAEWGVLRCFRVVRY